MVYFSELKDLFLDRAHLSPQLLNLIKGTADLLNSMICFVFETFSFFHFLERHNGSSTSLVRKMGVIGRGASRHGFKQSSFDS